MVQVLPLHHFPMASSSTAQIPGATASYVSSVTSLFLIVPTPMDAEPCSLLSFLCPLMSAEDMAFRDIAFRDTPHSHVHLVCRRLHHAGRARDVRGQACVDLGCWGVFLASVSLPESAFQPCTTAVAKTGTTMTHCQEIARNAEFPEHLLCWASDGCHMWWDIPKSLRYLRARGPPQHSGGP